MMQENDHERLAELISDIQFTMLTTINPLGELHSRPMVTIEGAIEDGVLWFFTRLDSVMVKEIQQNKQVNVNFSETSAQKFISLSGTADVVEDKLKMKLLWNDSLSTWFPEGFNDLNLALIRIEVIAAEFWESPMPGKRFDTKNHSGHIDFRSH